MLPMLVLPGEEKGTQLVSYPPPPAHPPTGCPGQLVSSPRKQLQSQASGENSQTLFLLPGHACFHPLPSEAVALSLPGVVTPVGV